MTEEHDETADIVAHAVAQERAAVVAWLRAEAYLTLYGVNSASDVADAIERGEHRPGRA